MFALAALAATASFAQSSVEIWGIVDAGVQSVKENGVSKTQLSSSGLSSSQLGFRGVEDLGGGMKAAFWLEGTLTNDEGTSAGLKFARRSTLDLAGSFGAIRLGRDYTPTFWNHTVYDPFGTNGVGSSVNTFTVLGSGATTLVRANNSIGYFTPTMGGLQAQVMMSVKESKDANTANEYTGIRVTYNAGPLSAAVATASEGSTSAAASFKRTNVGVAYNMGVARPMFQYTTAKFGANKVNHYLVGAVVPMGATNIKASYVRSNYTGANDANQLAIGADYNLSKRTAVYATYARISNDGAATYSVPGGVGAAAADCLDVRRRRLQEARGIRKEVPLHGECRSAGHISDDDGRRSSLGRLGRFVQGLPRHGVVGNRRSARKTRLAGARRARGTANDELPTAQADDIRSRVCGRAGPHRCLVGRLAECRGLGSLAHESALRPGQIKPDAPPGPRLRC